MSPINESHSQAIGAAVGVDAYVVATAGAKTFGADE